jgi:sialidase-1
MAIKPVYMIRNNRISTIVFSFAILINALACDKKNKERIYPRVEPPSSILTYVFQKGTEDYSCYRIPALIKTKAGTLLAFAEGRKNNCTDEGDIDLVVKRSIDGGKTWSKLAVIWSDAVNTCGNPVPVVDQNTGKIHLLMTWNDGDDKIGEINAGTSKNTRRVYVTTSTDDGIHWEAPKEITSSVKLSNWGWYATGPCHGIQIKNGPHAGRLIVPCDYIEVGPARRGNSHVIYSDDAGATWKLGGVVPVHSVLNPNESTVAEVAGGKLLLNMRVGANQNQRVYSTSTDGGLTWSPLVQAPELKDPVCQGSLVSAETATGVSVFFSNPASTARNNMTIKMSTNEGVNWQKKKVVFNGPSGYSDLLMFSADKTALLYEAGVGAYTDGIAFKIVPVSELQ